MLRAACQPSSLKRARIAPIAHHTRREAAFETKLSLKQFPDEPVFSIEQVESGEFWPEGFPHKQPRTLGRGNG